MDKNLHAPGKRRREARHGGPLAPGADAIHRVVRWTVGHVRGLYAALGAFMLIGLLASTAALGAFGLVAEWMLAGSTQTVDEFVVRWARGHRSALWDTWAIVGAALGSGTATWIVLGLGSLVLWTTRHHFSVLLLWISLAGGRWLSSVLKEMFGRPRPQPADWRLEAFGKPIDFPSSASFPSGHAVTSMVIFGTLAYLIVRLEPTVRQRRATLAAALVLILWIGTSRIYLGVHYPSDVVAGFLAGFVWLCFSAFAIEVLRYVAATRPDVHRQEDDLERGMEPVREAMRGSEGR